MTLWASGICARSRCSSKAPDRRAAAAARAAGRDCRSGWTAAHRVPSVSADPRPCRKIRVAGEPFAHLSSVDRNGPGGRHAGARSGPRPRRQNRAPSRARNQGFGGEGGSLGDGGEGGFGGGAGGPGGFGGRGEGGLGGFGGGAGHLGGSGGGDFGGGFGGEGSGASGHFGQGGIYERGEGVLRTSARLACQARVQPGDGTVVIRKAGVRPPGE